MFRLLSLKGADLDGRLLSLLGRALQMNRSLLRLSLEWNNVGVNLEALAAFCTGLQANSKLETLNLRYSISSNHKKCQFIVVILAIIACPIPGRICWPTH